MRKNRIIYASHARWRKLVTVSRTKDGHPCTKNIAIPVSILRKMGFDRDDEIYGRWNLKENKLVLELKKEGARYGVAGRKASDQGIL